MNDMLRCYAFYNPKVGYYQGMNYLMGFLYTILKEENTTFEFFVNLIEKKMEDLFDNNLEKVNVHFYIVDRLTEILVPNLHEHLKVKRALDSRD